jgi:Amt family ammonium transporter
MGLNGALAGLVGITAPCASVSTLSAVIIGAAAGLLVFVSVLFIDNKLRVDDPVGAISVHGVCGAWGTLAVGLFGSTAIDSGLKSNGLFVDGSLEQLGIQALGVAAVAVFTLAAAFVLFGAIKATIGLRVSDQEQIEGLDLGEHGQEAYPNFASRSGG